MADATKRAEEAKVGACSTFSGKTADEITDYIDSMLDDTREFVDTRSTSSHC